MKSPHEWLHGLHHGIVMGGIETQPDALKWIGEIQDDARGRPLSLLRDAMHAIEVLKLLQDEEDRNFDRWAQNLLVLIQQELPAEVTGRAVPAANVHGLLGCPWCPDGGDAAEIDVGGADHVLCRACGGGGVPRDVWNSRPSAT